jgi:hypothetical protein
MSVHQIRQLELALKIHAIGSCFKGQLHGGKGSMALQYAMAAGIEQVLQGPGEKGSRGSLERSLLDFIDDGGIMVYVKDQGVVVGVVTVGRMQRPDFDCLAIKEIRIGSRIRVWRDEVYSALLTGVSDVARFLADEEKKVVAVFMDLDDSDRRLLRRTLQTMGYASWSMTDACMATVAPHKQLAA